MKTMEESDRYNYPDLTPDSIVVDGGGYECNWANEIWKKYQPKIYVFEPIKAFADNCFQRRLDPSITIVNKGLGAFGRYEVFNVQNDSSGIHAGSGVEETVEIFPIGDLVQGFARGVDLLKLNIEGMELEVLDALIGQDLMPRIVNLQVQFHRVPGAQSLIPEIQKGLEKTHDLVYDAPWFWSGYKLRQ